jgi:peptidoglycan hydrolase-like protein with peptidoglycan-binding domain
VAGAPGAAEAGAAQAPATGAAGATDPQTIAYVQKRLNDKGYDAGTPDGRIGARTLIAIKDFQNDRGLPSDGKITPQLLDLLHKT